MFEFYIMDKYCFSNQKKKMKRKKTQNKNISATSALKKVILEIMTIFIVLYLIVIIQINTWIYCPSENETVDKSPL